VNVNHLSCGDTLWLHHRDVIKINPRSRGTSGAARQKKRFPYMRPPRAELKVELRAGCGDWTCLRGIKDILALPPSILI